MSLRARLDELLHIARTTYGDDSEAQDIIAGLAARLDEPLRIALVGRVKAGKSTLLNALVGEELAPTDAGECTKIVTWYQRGDVYRVLLRPVGGSEMQVPFHRNGGALEVELGVRKPAEVDRLTVEWPTSRLASMTLIDTPGLDSAVPVHSERTQDFLSMGEEGVGEADAVVYLLRHLHANDIAFLEAFHEDGYSSANPVNAIAVLSRADEIGVCRLDAMESAMAVANRYTKDTHLRQLCQQVLPVAGLLAEAAATLTEAEFQSLRTIAALSAEEREELLLTVDRLVGESTVDVTPLEREELIGRLGLFGVRHSVSRIADGSITTASALCADLRDLSGITQFEATLADLFGGRRDVLKAQVVLSGLDDLTKARSVEGSEALAAELEKFGSNAHEFAETRLLSALRARLLDVSDEESAELERLLAPTTATDPLTVDEILDAIGRWQARAESPLVTREGALAARTVVRSYEGLYARLSAPET